MSQQGGRQGRVFFYVLFVILAILVLVILSPYLETIAIAVVTVLLLKPIYNYYLRRRQFGGGPRAATTLTLITFFLLILIPLVLIGYLIINQASNILDIVNAPDFDASFSNLIADLEDFLRQIPALGDIQLDEEQVAAALASFGTTVLNWLANLAVSLGTSLPSLFINAIVFLVVVASLLPTLDDLGKRVTNLSPMDVNITQIYLLKSQEMIISVIKGVFLLAIIQGLIMGVFYWLAKVPFVPFWTLLSIAFAVLPVVGISFIVLPMAIIFFLVGDTTSAVIVLIGFYVFVNPTDLILRPRLVSKEAYLNFTLMLLALFGGLAIGGLLGMIYGPVVMILFVTTIEIYASYYSDRPEEPEAEQLALANSDPLPEAPSTEPDEDS